MTLEAFYAALAQKTRDQHIEWWVVPGHDGLAPIMTKTDPEHDPLTFVAGVNYFCVPSAAERLGMSLDQGWAVAYASDWTEGSAERQAIRAALMTACGLAPKELGETNADRDSI